MLGIILLTIALFLYPSQHKRWSILLFIIFSMQGLRFIPEDVIGFKYMDMAFIYMLVINVCSAIYERDTTHYLPYERYLVWGLLGFLLCSAAFSFIHYRFSFIQILQGGRHLFLFAAYFFLRKVNREDIVWIIKAIFYITLVHAGLYIIQCVTNLPVLMVSAKSALNIHTGEYRYYNYPILMTFYILLALLHPEQLGSRLAKVSILVMIIAIVLTQGRTYIVANALICLVGLLLRGKLTRVAQWAIIGGIAILPFMDVALSRFSEDKTESDITQILRGEFINAAQTGQLRQGTLTYRFAWVYERYLYIKERPISEKAFGLGMISDSQTDVVNSKYHFAIGLADEEHGVYQLSTPDIAWGNFVTKFGAVGTIILLSLWIALFVYMFKLRHLHPLLQCEFLFLLYLSITSISESHLSDLGNLAFPMLLCAFGLSLYLEYGDDEEEEDEEYNNDEEYELIGTYESNPY